jgi:hypothetical protein
MTHVTEEQLVLYFYGESDETTAIADHLAACPACRADLAGIQRTLNAVDGMEIPERGPAYGEQVWQAVSPRIRPRLRLWPVWMEPRRLAAFAAIAAMVIVAYLAGRGTVPAPARQELAGQVEAARNRILLVNMSDHLERSKRILVELANGEPSDLSQDRATAEDLLAATRLYRLSSQSGGQRGGQLGDQPGLTDLLDELEQILTEASNAGPSELGQIQRRMAQQDLLFKIRVVDAQMRQKQRQPIEISSN